ncbi:MAG TPA: hypothetical protein VKY85_24810 [Candidatus Angelobacter sp.]|nr:hypothetical protein [Candidatus Angelobacter sp.]
MISESNPLQRFFHELVEQNYSEVGVRNSEIQGYVSNLLTEFCESENLYKIKDENGQPLDDVGAMILAADPIFGSAPSFDRERQVRKHIGDYALYFTGMQPQALNHFRLRNARMEGPVDFIRAGKESYFIVSKFEYFEYAKVASLFRTMSQEFEQLVYGLNQVRNQLEEMQHPIVHKTKEFLM